MKLKSFFAASVEEALSQARREFGPEAVLVQSRRSLPEAKEFGEYEVVCALLEDGCCPSGCGPQQKERPQEFNRLRRAATNCWPSLPR